MRHICREILCYEDHEQRSKLEVAEPTCLALSAQPLLGRMAGAEQRIDRVGWLNALLQKSSTDFSLR